MTNPIIFTKILGSPLCWIIGLCLLVWLLTWRERRAADREQLAERERQQAQQSEVNHRLAESMRDLHEREARLLHEIDKK
jgi:hypothetical protein